MLKGDFATTGPAAMLRQLAAGAGTGCLHLAGAAGEQAQIYLRGGQVYAVHTADRRPRQIPQQISQQVPRLVSSAALAPEALARRQLQDSLADLLDWSSGQWTFRVNERAREHLAPLTPVGAILAELAHPADTWRPDAKTGPGSAAVPALPTRGRGDEDDEVDVAVRRVSAALAAILGPLPVVEDPFAPRPRCPEPAVPEPAVPEPTVPEPAVPVHTVPEPTVGVPTVPEPAAPDLQGDRRAAARRDEEHAEARVQNTRAFAELSATAGWSPDAVPHIVPAVAPPPGEPADEGAEEVDEPKQRAADDDPPVRSYGDQDTDMAALLRELASLGLDDDARPPSDPAPQGQPVRPRPAAAPGPAAAAAAAKRRKGLFGRG